MANTGIFLKQKQIAGLAEPQKTVKSSSSAGMIAKKCDELKELLIEKNRYGSVWLHFAVRPPSEGNRRHVRFLNG